MNNGVDLEVALRAKGCGSTLFCKDNLNLVEFGTEYTHNNITKEFFLENRGRSNGREQPRLIERTFKRRLMGIRPLLIHLLRKMPML